ncbi:Niemann-Pick C1-like protein 1 [Limulus polyphemus]|uniref:Niemann-Pick C1-like protein 1 n=1 Tax=Limulus polyphemus TaxID=6850 RepID=A0ABM1SG99_LIMPO|nr:Niemann-Pick C1-like protein 1 [Limulus polyphemus]
MPSIQFTSLHFVLFQICGFIILVNFGYSEWTADKEDGHCVMYDQCGQGTFGQVNCLYNGSAQLLVNEETIKILKKICPEFQDEVYPRTCCSKLQVEKLLKDLKFPRRLGFGRCPSCIRNFQQMFCQLTCSPRQSRFLRVIETKENDHGQTTVEELEYFISLKYAEELFSSCENVEGIFPGTSLLKDMMCGIWGRKCNPQRWLEFMGSTPKNFGFSPFQINYVLLNETENDIDGQLFYPMNEKTTKCSEPSELEGEACLCKDCPLVCNSS